MTGLPMLLRAAATEPRSYSEDDNAVDVTWTTGATVRRRRYRLFDDAEEFDEELVVSANAVRLDRLNGGAPFLDSHDQYALSSVIGSVVPGTARISGGQGVARVKLSRAPEHAGIAQNIVDGIIRNVSVGYRVHAIERIEQDGKVPLVRVTDWEPMELSAVAVGADPGARTRNAEPTLFPVSLTVIRDAAAKTPHTPLRMRMRQRLIHEHLKHV